MIYACDNEICRFIFERAGAVDSCPDCGKSAIREATEAEQEEYRKNLLERSRPSMEAPK